MSIENIGSKVNLAIGGMLEGTPESSGHEAMGAPSFSKMLTESVNDVNNLLTQADEANTNLAIGKSENLHEAMIATEKAETALKFLVQVRNKAMEAYNEIMRMQI